MALTAGVDGRPRVAVVSLHTSPLDQPGTGDSGGMNVYIRQAADRLTACGVDVDVFTRRRDPRDQPVEELPGGSRIIRVKAGPPVPVPKQELPRFLPEFLGGVLGRQRADGTRYDVVHSHYWLSGWVGRSTKEIWRVPLVASFHTLGKVKNYSLAQGEPPEPPVRLSGEEAVIAEADRIMAATPVEAAQLVGLYRADPGRIRLAPPGVDHQLFFPRPRDQARDRLHLTGVRLVLFVGRLQPHKGPDIAVRALAEAIARDPRGTRDVVLAVVGGPSGSSHGAEVAHLMDLAGALGVGERVVFFPPQPQQRLADFYAAAECVLVPSRSESFGLVALEAQACGTPVVAAAVGGLRYVVEDGATGYLVEGHDPADHAERLLQILADPTLGRRLGTSAVARSLRFSWDATAVEILSVYRELLQ
ncbi:MAG TPA: D-inositol-3-phosphate glycosyltransferase, partial [Actinomycetota bacterium]|nr:D-inositol-3-phosphate glycosyltransferase [Actinomycetota bacterium]